MSETLQEKLSRKVTYLSDKLDELQELMEQIQGDVQNPPAAGHPMQAIVRDDKGTIRFHRNALVCYLLDAGPYDMNHLACLPGVSRQDYEQFAQLIGYSVSGFGDLSYASNTVVHKADQIAAKMG